MSFIEWPADLHLPQLRALALTNSTLVLGREDATAAANAPATLAGLVRGCPGLRWLFLGGATLVTTPEPLGVPAASAFIPIERLPTAAAQAAVGARDPAGAARGDFVVETTFIPRALVDGLVRRALPAEARVLRLDSAADAAWLLQAALPPGSWRQALVRACFDEGAAGADCRSDEESAAPEGVSPHSRSGSASPGSEEESRPGGAWLGAPAPVAAAALVADATGPVVEAAGVISSRSSEDAATSVGTPGDARARACRSRPPPGDTEVRLADVLWLPDACSPTATHPGLGHAIAFATMASSTRRTPLHAAALHAQLPLARLLLRLQALAVTPTASAALVERKDDRGATPLLRACEEGDAAIITAILGAGASLSVRNHKEETPLYICALKGHAAGVAALAAQLPRLDPAAAVAALTGPDGWTALHAAALSGSLDALHALLELSEARACGSGAAAEDCRREEADGEEEAEGGAAVGSGGPCRGLLDARTRYGSTALHIAARSGRVEAVRALLAAGADARAVDSCGDSAATLASAMRKRGARAKGRGAAAACTSGGGVTGGAAMVGPRRASQPDSSAAADAASHASASPSAYDAILSLLAQAGVKIPGHA